MGEGNGRAGDSASIRAAETFAFRHQWAYSVDRYTGEVSEESLVSRSDGVSVASRLRDGVAPPTSASPESNEKFETQASTVVEV